MVELKIDPIAALIPIGIRPAPAAVAFASYLDQAGSTVATTPVPEPIRNRVDAHSRHGPTPVAVGDAQSAAGEQRDGEEGLPDLKAGNHAAQTDAASNDTVPSQHNGGSPQSEEGTGGSTDHADSSDPAPAQDDTVGQDTESLDRLAADPQEQPVETEAGSAKTAEIVTPQPSKDAEQEVPPPHAEATAGKGGEMPAAGERDGIQRQSAQDPRAGGREEGGKAEAGQPPGEPATTTRDEMPPVPSAKERDPSLNGAESPMPEDALDGEGGEEAASRISSDSMDAAQKPRGRRGAAPTARDTAPTPHSQATDSPPAPESQNHSQLAAKVVEAAGGESAGMAATPAASDPGETRSPTAPAASVEPIEGNPAETLRSTNEPATRSTVPASNARDADPSEGVDRVRFVQRVARAIEAAGNRGGTIRLRLSPPELGSLRVEITVNHSVMNAHLEAENETARQLLLDNLPVLRERLAEQNIKIEQFQVDVSDRQPGETPDRPDDRSQSDRGATHPKNRTNQDANGEETDPQAFRRTRYPGELSQLDVLI